jgi:hypothetical protein
MLDSRRHPVRSVSGLFVPTTSRFQVALRFVTPMTRSQQSAFTAAAARWSNVVTGDLPAVSVSVPAGACGTPHAAMNESVDDLLVLVSVDPIDGPGKVVGSAGPCYVRGAGGLPVVGVIQLDAADLPAMEANGTLGPIIVHELGHVLGIGTLWNRPPLIGAGTPDPYFTGRAATAAFRAAGGASYAGSAVPVENIGGPGTRDSHWRESVFKSEVMTGWISGPAAPLSAVTIGSLQDLGYLVDAALADGFSIGEALGTHDAENSAIVEIREQGLPVAPVPVDASGARMRVRPMPR